MSGRTAARAAPPWKHLLGLSAHIKDEDIGDMAALAVDAGLSHLEIVAERFWALPDGGGPHRWREIRGMLDGHGLRPFVHSSYIEINMASLNSRLREAALGQSLRCLEFAAFLGAEYLVVHPGNLNRNYPASLLSEARERLLESLGSLCERAETVGVAIALENGWNGENRPLIRDGEEHAGIIESVGSASLKAFLDIGHANTFEVDLKTYFRRLRPHLAGIHLHDNNGKKDEHLPPGKGSIRLEDFRLCFHAAVPVIIEVNSMEDIMTSLAYLEENMVCA